MFYYYVAWVPIMSALDAGLMIADKRRAVRHRRRIREETLLFFAAVGGAVGGWIAMYAAHHKTRKRHFRLLMPLFAVLQISLLFFFCFHKK